MILVVLVEDHPAPSTDAGVRRELTAIENTPERMATIGQSLEALIEVGLVVREGDLLRATPAALRAGELEMGL